MYVGDAVHIGDAVHVCDAVHVGDAVHGCDGTVTNSSDDERLKRKKEY